jgi:hypothetical protein
MKKNQPNSLVLFAKTFASVVNSLFFSDNREFQRLKSFIAS